jgi:hypothetical protein
MGWVIEQPMRELIEGGFDAVHAYQEQHGILKFHVWMGLIFLKTHLTARKAIRAALRRLSCVGFALFKRNSLRGASPFSR